MESRPDLKHVLKVIKVARLLYRLRSVLAVQKLVKLVDVNKIEFQFFAVLCFFYLFQSVS